VLPISEIQKSQSFISTSCYRNVRDELQKTSGVSHIGNYRSNGKLKRLYMADIGARIKE
jgi:hypothetical protein